MTFNPTEFLEQHGGDPIKALSALEAQRLEAQEGRDSEGQSAATARRERNEARARTRELEAELTAYREHGSASEVATSLDVLDTLRESITAAGITSGDIAAQVTAKLQRAAEADTLERTVLAQRAASAYNLSEDDLSEWLAGRPLTTETRKGEDGQEVTVYGVATKDGEGEVFKPLSEFKTFAALSTAAQPQAGATTGPQFVAQRVQTQQSNVVNTADRSAQIAAEGRGTI